MWVSTSVPNLNRGDHGVPDPFPLSTQGFPFNPRQRLLPLYLDSLCVSPQGTLGNRGVHGKEEEKWTRREKERDAGCDLPRTPVLWSPSKRTIHLGSG